MIVWVLRNRPQLFVVDFGHFEARNFDGDMYLRGLAGMLGNKVSKGKRSKIMENKVMVLLEIMRVNRHEFGTL